MIEELAAKIDALASEIAEMKALLRGLQIDRPPRRLRLPEVLERVVVGKTTWWWGLRKGATRRGIWMAGCGSGERRK